MHKPFDLDAAKAGEPVEYLGLGEKYEFCRFLGVSESGDGYFVIERVNGKGFQLSYATSADLRMAPKKVTVRYRVAILIATGSELLYPESVSNGAEAEDMSNRPDFIQWADSWQEVEVPQ